MAFGTHDFALLDLGDHDVERVKAMQTIAGVSFGNILTAMNNAMSATVDNLDPVVGALTTRTTDVEIDDVSEDGFQVQYGSEFAVAMPQYSADINHALPIRKMDQAVQFTEEFLENSTEPQIARRLNRITTGYQNAFEALVLEALFNPNEVPITRGSSTMSPKFIGYKSDDPAYGKITLGNGTVITNPYSHYINDTPANLATAIATALSRLKARGKTGPFDIVGSSGAIGAISALPSFVASTDPLVQEGSGSEVARGVTTNHVGVLKGLNVRVYEANDRIQDDGSSYWFAVFKSNGQWGEDNAVGWKYEPRYGVAPLLRTRSMYPFDYATTIVRAGFSAYDRFGAVLVNIEATANGYTAPSIRG